jgi:hypothetical protein
MHFNPTRLLRHLEAIPPRRFVLTAVAAVSLAILYVVPVAATAWVAGPRRAFLMAVIAGSTWAVADRIGSIAQPARDLASINDISMFALSSVVVVGVGTLRREVYKQRKLVQEVQRRLLPERIPSVAGRHGARTGAHGNRSNR